MNDTIFMPDGEQVKVVGDAQDVSDGCHTFRELYQHRCLIFIALMKSHPLMSWRSLRHNDGSFHEGWFIAGMRTPKGDITYHLPESMYHMLHGIEEKKFAPAWDGHTSNDVLERLEDWILDGTF
ncbi:MAG: hypothetical protein C4586_08295 [Anaerolineaceae bacterium]|nr:MAG: hypothetical protein C4586_08295 [Anaerolineaceae bacterium]